MKRTKKKKTTLPKTADAIFTADWHLREDTPVCRSDDFITAQWNKVRQVRRLQEKYGCPVLHAGDLFHHWKPSPALLTKCIQELPQEFYSVYGNHDLPQHNMELAYKSGMTTLRESGKLHVLDDGHWNIAPTEGFKLRYWDEDGEWHFREIAVWHKFVYTGKAPFPGAEKEPEGHSLLNKYPDFDIILTGDNHQQFVCKEGSRLLVNPGNLTRQTADQLHFEPAVWLYDARSNTVQAHNLSINKEAVSRIHIEKKEERDGRIQAFVERLETEWEASLNFEDNLRRFATENEIEEPVMKIVYRALEE